MKLSSAAITVAAISLLSTTHAAPLAFENGAITGRLHHRRGSDISEISDTSFNSHAEEAIEGLNIAFEPSSRLILPRIFNFLKRQVSSGATSLTTTQPTAQTADEASSGTAGTSDTDLHTTIMTPDLGSYGFATHSGPGTALAPVREVKE